MTDPSSPHDSEIPEGVPSPPPPRPPDIIDPRKAGPTYVTKEDKGKGKKQKERTHPTDPYQPLKKKKGCGGCCGCLGGSLLAIILLFVGFSVAITYWGPGRFVQQGFKVVNLGEAEATITEAPSEPTFYIGRSLTYTVPKTEVPIAIAAQEIVISGDFLKEVSLTGVKVTALSTARFAENLEIYAMEFFDKGVTLKGDLTGRVMKSLQ
ncbi:MAG: hypothetical protein KBF76_16710 [Verrucomicrobiales bacterium]|nr:hypothetical protein [Verrucomicrobiales bacterium]HQZ26562.1 hypothetical protein [Verrucomicrobiales bacterium]